MKNTFRTSNNIFRIEVQAYITDSLVMDSFEVNPEIENLPQALQQTVDAFNNWFSPYEQRRSRNIRHSFIEWLQCLPSEIYITPYYHEQELLMEEWFNNCEQPYKSQKDPSAHFYHFVSDNFQRLCKQHGVSF